ncbi:hypothetical protein ACFX10_028460 [Malus domestica]|uniref:Uncharacterized protein n=1 Tax=Malus domestica TaxID=3750 RepID=A0A498KCU8_MALDO|nr:hypothetical protein DVH24_006625 [Malus domestica]
MLDAGVGGGGDGRGGEDQVPGRRRVGDLEGVLLVPELDARRRKGGCGSGSGYPGLAGRECGVYGNVNPRVNTWHNVLLATQRKA